MNTDGLDEAERGFAEALQRLQEWVERGDYQNPLPLPDVLDDLYRMEEFHRKRLSGYFTHRDRLDPNGPVVAGIMYVRGLNVHSSALVATIEGRRPFTLGRSTLGGGDTLQGPGVTLQWKPFADLPEPGKKEKNGRDVMYQQMVEGRDVLETFEESRQFFEAIRQVP